MTDVLLYEAADGGEINVNDGAVQMSGGLETAAYLSLFGGTGWWADIDEEVDSRKMTATTQAALETLNPTSGNLRRIEDAAKSDLAWFVSDGAASSVDALATIPELNQVKLTITITAEGKESEFVFVENWKQPI